MRLVNRRLPTAAALLTALALTVLPAVALAQNAGDQQYSDPLAGSSTKTTSTPAKSSKSTVATTAPSATKAPPVSLPTTTTTAAAAPTTSTSSSSPSSSSSPTSLPRTGLNEWVLLAIAAGLLLAGFGLRLRTAGVRRR
jgi:hypothetical protein